MKKSILFLIILSFAALLGSQSVLAQETHPILGEITWQQLHKDYEDVPHRYDLFANVTDPTAGASLDYNWSIDCGYFFGPTNFKRVEWRYDTPGECINAIVGLKVANSIGAKTLRKQYVFTSSEAIEYIEYPLPVQEKEPAEPKEAGKKEELVGPIREGWEPPPKQEKSPQETAKELIGGMPGVPAPEEIKAAPPQQEQEKPKPFWERFKEGWKESPLWLKILLVIGIIITIAFLIFLAVKLGIIALIIALLKALWAVIAGLVKAGIPIAMELFVRFWPLVIKWFERSKSWIGLTLDRAGKKAEWLWRKITGKN